MWRTRSGEFGDYVSSLEPWSHHATALPKVPAGGSIK